MGDGFMLGNIKFIFYVLYCEACDIEISAEAMKKYESEMSKRERERE
jgi:hypothetical protein